MVCLKVLMLEILVPSLEQEAGCEPLLSMSSINPNRKNVSEHTLKQGEQKSAPEILPTNLSITRHQTTSSRDIFFIWLDINGYLSRSGKNLLYCICSTPVQLMLRSTQASKCHLPILRPNARLEGVSQGSTGRIRE